MHCVSNAIQDQLLLLLVMFLSLGIVRKPKKWQQPVRDHFDGSENFFSELLLLDSGLKSQQGTIQRFWNKIKFEVFTIDFKGNKWLLWSRCLELDKRKSPEVWKNSPGREQKKLHVNYLRTQLVPAEIFACIRRYSYLRISLLAALAGNFARASFTVHCACKTKCCSNFILHWAWFLMVFSLKDYSKSENATKILFWVIIFPKK